MDSLPAAIMARWEDAGLNASVAKLYLAGDSTNSKTNNRAGSPEGTELPRAEYTISRGPPTAKTRNSRLYMPVVTFKMRGKTALLANGYVNAVNAAFVNSETATTNPLTTTTGDVFDVDDAGEGIIKVDDNVYEGEVTITIRHRINNRVPA